MPLQLKQQRDTYRLGTESEKLDYLMSNLNDYFTGQAIVFRVEGDKKWHMMKKIMAMIQ